MEKTLSTPPDSFKWASFLLDRGNGGFLHALFGLFVAVTLFQSFHHVPWRDEGQAWFMARDLDLGNLFLEARHDGHPILWHLCLKLCQDFGAGYIAMMVLNSAFIISAIWLLFYRSRLPLQRLPTPIISYFRSTPARPSLTIQTTSKSIKSTN